MDDIRLFEFIPIDCRLEYERIGVAFADPESHLAVDPNIHRSAAMHAFGLNQYGYRLFSQSSLHEGRCKRILGSGGEQPLPRAEDEFVRGFFTRDRVCPADLAFIIPDQEKKPGFQIIQNVQHQGVR